jgi:hypothetical protein
MNIRLEQSRLEGWIYMRIRKEDNVLSVRFKNVVGNIWYPISVEMWDDSDPNSTVTRVLDSGPMEQPLDASQLLPAVMQFLLS